MKFRVKDTKTYVGSNSYSRTIYGSNGRFRGRYSQRVTFPVLYEMEGYTERSVSLFSVVFIILAVFAYLSAVTGRNQVFTFTGMLQAFSNSPSIPLADIVNFMGNLRIEKDWTVFGNWLRDFINDFLLPLNSIVVYFSVAVAQLVVYIIWFLKILFVGI